MYAQHERPWPAIDLAEPRCCLAFGSSVEDMADVLHRDVEDFRHKITIEAQRAGACRRSWGLGSAPTNAVGAATAIRHSRYRTPRARAR
jgi:hypothetical protein